VAERTLAQCGRDLSLPRDLELLRPLTQVTRQRHILLESASILTSRGDAVLHLPRHMISHADGCPYWMIWVSLLDDMGRCVAEMLRGFCTINYVDGCL
jgi:hypothetical protein